jgi:hypothetical protein
MSGITYPPSLLGVFGWVMCVFWVGGAVVTVKDLFNFAPQVVISDQGIEDCRTKLGVIEWDDIIGVDATDVRVVRYGCIVKMLSVFVYDREKYFSRLPPPPRWMRFITEPQPGPGEIQILFIGLTPWRDKVLEYLRQHYPHKILQVIDSDIRES